MVVLDTSVIIEHLRQPPEKSKLIKLLKKYPQENFGISIVSIHELYEGKSTKDQEKENQLLSTISSLEILSYTWEVAKLAGIIARDLHRPIELADAAIAATTILNAGELFTLNKKDFSGIKDLKFAEIK